MTADTLFHATLVRAAHNPYLSSVFESVHTTLINYEYRTWVANGTVPAWLEADEAASLMDIHQPILDAVRTRDPDAAREAVLWHHLLMAKHLEAAHELPKATRR
jgi:GntR family transcriptional repressor for pyruvate dehydrogenase complex